MFIFNFNNCEKLILSKVVQKLLRGIGDLFLNSTLLFNGKIGTKIQLHPLTI